MATYSINKLNAFSDFKINESINYKLLSLRHKVLTTTEPSYLYMLTSVQSPRNTRSSSSVTISRPSSSSSLKITNRWFRFASPHLWNQLPVSFRQSTNQSPSHSPHFIHSSSCTSSSFLPSLTPLFHSRLKTLSFFTSLSHHRLLVPYPWTAFSDLDRFSALLCSSVCFIFLSLFLFSFWSRVVD